MASDLKTLIKRLDPVCRTALERAAELCVAQTHYNVEIEHVLLELLEQPDTDAERVLRHYGIDVAKVVVELREALGRFRRGNSRTPALSPHLPTLLEEAWVRASLEREESSVSSGVLLRALVETDTLRLLVLSSAPALDAVPPDRLRGELDAIVGASAERAKGKPEAAAGPAPAGKALAVYTVDLTAAARAGRLDPVTGREAEIRQVIDILMRRRQNNPILTGEAGVGKTAVVEGFATRVAAGEVPPALRDVSVRMLDVGLLQAGAGVRGEFEERLKGVVDEVKGSPQPVILFIDEAHTLIGAGAPAGQGDAANLLKPALARGELRTIAATTWAEYKKHVEKDPALARRFQVVKVGEPDEETAIAMLRGLVAKLEAHHGVAVLHEAVVEAVRLSHRYITGRQLPDKAVSVLDTACARVAVALSDVPPDLEDARRQADAIEHERTLLARETDRDHAARAAVLSERLRQVRIRIEALEGRWQRELAAVRTTLASGTGFDALDALQGETPMVPARVDGRVVAQVVSAWTGIPVGKMLSDDIRAVLSLRERLAARVIGQDAALEAIVRRIHTARAGLDEPGKPTGVFLLVGPSGVGKTETALALADALFGGERHMVTVNMSEYQEAHTVSGLKGAPPGYVGYGAGGVLTEAVRRTPYAVVLLDEVEKAHPDVLELFYQVFDKGVLEDSEGVPVDFRNTVILLTSNLGSEVVARLGRNCGFDELVTALRPTLVRRFKPALLGRMVVVPYHPLGDGQIARVVRLKMERIRERVRAAHRAALTWTPAVEAVVAARCVETDSGARAVDHLLTHGLLPELSARVLARMADGQGIGKVAVSLDDKGQFTYRFLDS